MKAEQCLPYVFTLNELADYAYNRVKEGKLHWTSACIIGKTTYVAAMEYCADKMDLELSHELTKICDEAKARLESRINEMRALTQRALTS